jgi:hypothetical protein
LRSLVLKAWPEIVRGLIEKAVGGGYQQAKLLLELCDFPAQASSWSKQEDKQQLCDALLEGLRLTSADRAASTATEPRDESKGNQ